MDTILVTGATGNQGGAVARHLLRQGNFAVRALVRDTARPAAQALQQSGAELVQGDLNDRASVDRAVQGVRGVFSVQGLRDGLDVEVKQGKMLADAAKAANVAHFVYSSVGSAARNTGIPHFDSKFQIEEHIRAIGIPHTILRPVFFLFNYNAMRPQIKEGTLSMPLSPSTKLMQLSEDDYGRTAADVFAHPKVFLGRAIEVASVDMTLTETAAAFSRVLGKVVQYQQVPFDAFLQQAGEEQTVMFRWFENVGYVADFAALEHDFGPPTDLDTYLHVKRWGKDNG